MFYRDWSMIFPRGRGTSGYDGVIKQGSVGGAPADGGLFVPLTGDTDVAEIDGVPAPPEEAPGGVVATEVRLGGIDRAAWNAAAARSGASWRMALQNLRITGAKLMMSGRLKLFEFHEMRSGAAVRIGQCAVIQRANAFEFCDRLQLAPEHCDKWSAAMEAVLRRLGPGAYKYGWEWNLEPAREDAFARISGVKVISVRPITVQGVEFSRWPSWEVYWRQVSNNSRRDFARADKTYPDLRIVVRRGFSALRGCFALVRARAAMYRRKGLEFDSVRALTSCMAGVIFSPGSSVLAFAASGDRILSILHGFEFGETTYYVAGASGQGVNGAGWRLQLSMIKAAYDRHPDGKFLLGYVDYALHDEAIGGDLLRSRRAVRATDWPTSEVCFAYAPD
jgi:hypothetical protein